MAIPRTASVEMIRMSATEDRTSHKARTQSPEMLASANDVCCGLAAKHNTDHGQRSKCLDAQMQLEFANCQDCCGERKEAESQHAPLRS